MSFLKQHSKLLSNTFHTNHRSSPQLEERLDLAFCIWLLGKLAWTFHFSSGLKDLSNKPWIKSVHEAIAEIGGGGHEGTGGHLH